MGGRPKAPARNIELEQAQLRSLDEQSAALKRQADALDKQTANLAKQDADLATRETAAADADKRRRAARVSLLAGPETGALTVEEERRLAQTLGG
jgi:hypothetical protein